MADVKDIRLAEYNSLRSEIIARMNNQTSVFSYFLAALAGVVSGCSVLAQKDSFELIPWVILFTPLITTPLAFIFFDNEIMIFGTGGYIYDSLRPQLEAAPGDVTMLLDDRFAKLYKLTTRIHRSLSVGRWLLFLVPNMCGFAALLFIAPDSPVTQTVRISAALLNALLTGIIILAMIALWYEQNPWRAPRK
jgi:hypothetical protein